MTLKIQFASLALSRFRRFFGSRYHPERHYMRGAGPACAARNRSQTTT